MPCPEYNPPVSETISRPYLYLVVFTAGFTTLGVELSASRLLDPWFGNSLIVWASLIGLILLYLAAGYWLGGRIADRSPRLVTLLRLVAAGAFGVGLVPGVAAPVLKLASQGLADFKAGLLAGSMAGVLVLFAVPVTLLGCVRTLRRPAGHPGRAGQRRGRGAHLGTLHRRQHPGQLPAGAAADPEHGHAAHLRRAGLRPAAGRAHRVAAASPPVGGAARLAALARSPGLAGGRPGRSSRRPGCCSRPNRRFNYIQVVDAGGVERQLRLNEGEGIHSVYRPQGGLADGIWDYFLLAPAFNPAPYGPERVRRVAIVGLAAGTMAQLFTEAYGPIAIDGAELDPAIIAAGRAWFAMNEPNLNAVAMDGRRFLAQSGKGWENGRDGECHPNLPALPVRPYRH